jgi:hypothetical protein
MGASGTGPGKILQIRGLAQGARHETFLLFCSALGQGLRRGIDLNERQAKVQGIIR